MHKRKVALTKADTMHVCTRLANDPGTDTSVDCTIIAYKLQVVENVVCYIIFMGKVHTRSGREIGSYPMESSADVDLIWLQPHSVSIPFHRLYVSTLIALGTMLQSDLY